MNPRLKRVGEIFKAVGTRVAGVVAVGVAWAAAETLGVAAFVNRPPFISAGWLGAFRNRLLFYVVVAAGAWIVGCAGGFLYLKLRRRRAGGKQCADAGGVVAAAKAAAAWAGFFVGFQIYKTLGLPFTSGVCLILVISVALFVAVIFLYYFLGKKLYASAVRNVFGTIGKVSAAAGFLVACGAVVIYAAAGWNRPKAAGKPDIVLITIDAWRADAFRQDVTPNIYAFAQSNTTVFTAARAPATWTLPSLAAIFTGAHLVTDVRGWEMGRPLRPTLAEVLWANGYDTYAVIKNPYVDSNRELLRGFRHYYYADFNPVFRILGFYDTVWYRGLAGERYREREPGAASALLTARALNVLARRSPRPKFIWVHYLDPHYPYLPAADVIAHFAPKLDDRKRREIMAAGLKPENAFGLHVLYEAELKTTDDRLAPLLRVLAGRKDTVVVLTADHGEGFGEHGYVTHGQTVYDETANVPLLITKPGADGMVTDTPVSLIDLAPSILTYVGLRPPATMEGRRDLLVRRQLPPRDVAIALYGPEGLMSALVSGHRKIIMKRTTTGVVWEYYDLRADPREQRPLPFDAPAERMRNKLLLRFGKSAIIHGKRVLPARHAELKALGYF